MANTYTLIEAKTLGSATATVTFSSIPGTYTDLQLYVSGQGTTSVSFAASLKVVFNSSGGTAYSWRNLEGYNSSAGSNSSSGQAYGFGAFCPTPAQATWGINSIYIPNYAGSNNKSLSSDAVKENNSTGNIQMRLVASLWSNTAAITSVKLVPDYGNFAQYSTAILYGIKNS